MAKQLGNLHDAFFKQTLKDPELAALFLLAPNHEESVMGWLTQPYYDEGFATGKAAGSIERAKQTLTRLLQKRFGTVPTATRNQIDAADLISLEAWTDRIIDAPDLESIFNQEPCEA